MAGMMAMDRRALIASLLALAGLPGAQAGQDPLGELPANLGPHPRLLISDDSFAKLAARRSVEPLLDAFLKRLEADARALLDQPVCERIMTGKRLLWVSREVMRRVLVLAIAFRMGKGAEYAQRAQAEMLAAAAFTDWNPAHFLDVAEMTSALALGLDWLHPALDANARAQIVAAIAAKGLEPALDVQARHNSWHRARNNWNQVCWGGLTLGALAIWEDAPALAAQIVRTAFAQIAFGLEPYAPDGVYPEGPSYWSFGTHFQVLMIAALQSALGRDFGLASAPGLQESAAFMRHTQGPSGDYFNFGDGREQLALQPALFWFARQSNQPELVNDQIARIAQFAAGEDPGLEAARLMPLMVVWWPASALQQAPARLPRVWRAGDKVPLAIIRSAWDDPNAFYLAAKGGSAGLSHAHMDAGSFILEAGGVRWALDLGLQDYQSLESKGLRIWDMRQTSERWRVFRYHNLNHNTLSLDGQAHRVAGSAAISPIATIGPGHFRFAIELGPVLAESGVTARRTFDVWPDARRVQITDALTGLTPGAQVQWTMVTGAQVQTRGPRALLAQNGARLLARLKVQSARNAAFILASADPPDDGFNAPNPGRQRLIARAQARPDGNAHLQVTLKLEAPR